MARQALNDHLAEQHPWFIGGGGRCGGWRLIRIDTLPTGGGFAQTRSRDQGIGRNDGGVASAVGPEGRRGGGCRASCRGGGCRASGWAGGWGGGWGGGFGRRSRGLDWGRRGSSGRERLCRHHLGGNRRRRGSLERRHRDRGNLLGGWRRLGQGGQPSQGWQRFDRQRGDGKRPIAGDLRGRIRPHGSCGRASNPKYKPRQRSDSPGGCGNHGHPARAIAGHEGGERSGQAASPADLTDKPGVPDRPPRPV